MYSYSCFNFKTKTIDGFILNSELKNSKPILPNHKNVEHKTRAIP